MASGQPAPPAAEARWISRPSIDLIVGCGAWSAPLLLMAGFAASATRMWAVVFYLLALAFNYPHYMATIYRAYHTRGEFARYRLFTLHITAVLALMGVASHVWAPLVPWIFTLYITWSPWHYTAQNFGLTMMFARRNGVAPTDGERRRLYTAFVASYALLFISFHTGPSTDPLIRSIGIPPSIAATTRILLFFTIGVLGARTVGALIARGGAGAMLAPCVLVATQTLWFVAPALAQVFGSMRLPQTRYSSGVLAVMHSAQYLWIARYYAQREAESSSDGSWRPWAYAATLVGGGIALFVPGPWLASYLFHADFTQSVLIFTAIINIHHFILDGAVWKLRDRGIAALLVSARSRAAAEATAAARRPTRWVVGGTRSARMLPVAALLVLIGWAGVDQTRFILGTSDHDLSALARAQALNPYDSSVQRRKARLLIEAHRYDEAYAEYQRYLVAYPEDGEALLNLGTLAMQLGREEEAVQRWDAALKTDSARVNASRYLAHFWAGRADVLEQASRVSDAAHAYQRALSLDEQGGDGATLGVDWFNYGQFLRRHRAEPRLVLACLLRAEELLVHDSGERRGTVHEVRRAVELEEPGALAAVRRSPDTALAAARASY